MELHSLGIDDLKDLQFDMELTGFDGARSTACYSAGADGKEDRTGSAGESRLEAERSLGAVGRRILCSDATNPGMPWRVAQ
jgi:hypothetical protein